MARAVPRAPRLLDREAAALLVIDVQEAYRTVLHEWDRVVRAVAILAEGAAVLRIPVLVTEQYPKGLGHTVPEVAARLPAGTPIVEKRTLSCWGAAAFRDALAAARRRQVVVAGIEAHACVNQTVHDIVAAGYEVHVPHDATSSRRPEDYAVAWEKLRLAGAVPATVESALLELVETAEAPEFKVVQRLIR